MESKLAENKLKFELKTVTKMQVGKAIKSLKIKKSSGADGLSQEQLILGGDTLIDSLTDIIDTSITNGEFPQDWKMALVIPVLKKGDPSKKKITGKSAVYQQLQSCLKE